MRMVELINKKQMNQALTQAEINYMIEGFTKGDIPDYQMAAFNMAVYFQGMTPEEIGYMTSAMANSGDRIDLSAIKGVKVDKHSTGGVGDTTTLILAPLVAACGVSVAKMSGRGLGHTGGTIDKLESIPGFKVEMSQQEFIDSVNRHGLAVVGQTGNLTPADKKLYALRDVTSTVQSIPLIASSIMSKKIAAGSDAVVLDVKIGEGAFMKTLEEAKALATTMVEIGRQVGLKTLAVISNMNQPLGCAIGNSLEVLEAVDVLKGQGPDDLREVVLVLASQMLIAAGRVTTQDEARALLIEKIDSGEALVKFKEFILNQGGQVDFIDDPTKLAQAAYQIDFLSPKSGYLADWKALEVGEVAMKLGAGRSVKEDQIDPAVGIVLKAKQGDKVEEGQVLATLYSQQSNIDTLLEELGQALVISDHPVEVEPLIYEIIQ